jgi:hypothetical protein
MEIEEISCININGTSKVATILGYPKQCPICQHYIIPVRRGCHIKTDESEVHEVQIVNQCPKCENVFIAKFRFNRANGKYEYYKSEPIVFVEEECSEEIKNVSPNFQKIYNQARVAEVINLDQIAGMGYRKALEFLIKDFLIQRHPTDEDKIKSKLLGQCIDDYIDDPKLKACAKRAAWLGNDETHYFRKWEDKDINDLKTLIKLSTNWIQSIILTEKYTKDME